MTLIDHAKSLFCVEEFDQMAELGAFGKRRVVLIEGEIVDMPAQSEPHVVAFHLTAAVIQRFYGAGWVVRLMAPLRVGRDSVPEPDVVVLRGEIRDSLRSGRPTTAELVIEISLSTLRDDRQTMLALYAEAAVPEYWILNIEERQLEVYRKPDPARRAYSSVQIIKPGSTVSPLSAPVASIDPAELLP